MKKYLIDEGPGLKYWADNNIDSRDINDKELLRNAYISRETAESLASLWTKYSKNKCVFEVLEIEYHD